MQRTLAIIKPDAVKKNVAGEIIAQIQQAGFKILAMKLTRLGGEQAGEFVARGRGLRRYGSGSPGFPLGALHGVTPRR